MQVLGPYGVGIDVHSRFIQVCVLRSEEGKVLCSEAEYTTEWKDLLNARAWCLIQARKAVPDLAPQDLRYCVESTGCYHIPVVTAFGGRPAVVNPLLANPSRRKTDVLDARLLARHSIQGLWPESYFPEEKVRVLRTAIREVKGAERTAHLLRNRLITLLLRFGVTSLSFYRTTSARGWAIIEDLSEGRQVEDKGVPPGLLLPPAVRRIIKREIHAIEVHTEMAREALRDADELLKECTFMIGGTGEIVAGPHLFDLLRTVPGVGDRVAYVWLTEVVDISRFHTVDQCVAFCGMDPSLKVSAGKVTQHIRRGGNIRVRDAVKTAAGSLINRGSEAFGQWGRALWKRTPKGGWKKACAALARRMIVGLYHVHRIGEPFSYAGYRTAWLWDMGDADWKEQLSSPTVRVIQTGGYRSSNEVAQAWETGRLRDLAGIGARRMAEVEKWIRLNGHRTPV